jgi:hypothetical protein
MKHHNVKSRVNPVTGNFFPVIKGATKRTMEFRNTSVLSDDVPFIGSFSLSSTRRIRMTLFPRCEESRRLRAAPKAFGVENGCRRPRWRLRKTTGADTAAPLLFHFCSEWTDAAGIQRA